MELHFLGDAWRKCPSAAAGSVCGDFSAHLPGGGARIGGSSRAGVNGSVGSGDGARSRCSSVGPDQSDEASLRAMSVVRPSSFIGDDLGHDADSAVACFTAVLRQLVSEFRHFGPVPIGRRRDHFVDGCDHLVDRLDHSGMVGGHSGRQLTDVWVDAFGHGRNQFKGRERAALKGRRREDQTVWAVVRGCFGSRKPVRMTKAYITNSDSALTSVRIIRRNRHNQSCFHENRGTRWKTSID